MKLSGILLVLVFFGFGIAKADTMQMTDTMQKASCMMGKMSNQPDPMGEKCCPNMQPGACKNMCPWPRMNSSHWLLKFILLKVCCGMMFLCALLCLTVNILLTILVTQDMKRRASFNGLWIPLLLIAGIPTSIIYGLFRIGDLIKGKN
jgi:hypothetical protein